MPKTLTEKEVHKLVLTLRCADADLQGLQEYAPDQEAVTATRGEIAEAITLLTE